MTIPEISTWLTWLLLVTGIIAYNQLKTGQDKIMAKLEDIIADIQTESDLEDSILKLLDGVKAQLQDALSGVTLPADAQAKVDRAFNALESNKAKLLAATVANTPVAPEETSVVPPVVDPSTVDAPTSPEIPPQQ